MRFVVPSLEDPGSHPKAVRREVARRQQEVREAFRAHNERIRPLLPPPLQLLLDTHLDDARVLSLRIDPAEQTLRLCLEVGDAQRGISELCLEYVGAELSDQQISLFCLLAHHDGADVAWDELDVEQDADGEALYVHRMQWNTNVLVGRTQLEGGTGILHTLRPETEVRFRSLEAQITPQTDAPPTGRPRPDDFITVVGVSGDPDWVRDWQPPAQR
jgi:hypothetical protein